MMKFLKGFFTCFLFYLLGILACVLFGLTAISYYSVEQLLKATSSEQIPSSQKNLVSEVNPNIKELTVIGIKYADELNLFDNLTAEIKEKSVPDVCQTLCNPVFLDQEKLGEERSTYLMRYYKEAGSRALLDPLFRLRLKEIGFISTFFPKSLRDFYKELIAVNNPARLGKIDKLSFSFRLQYKIAKEILVLYLEKEEKMREMEQVKILRNLYQSCQKGSPHSQVISDCQTQTQNH